MKKKRHKSVPAVYAVLERDGRILLGRRQNTTYYDGWYGMPAGHVEANELPTHALVREIREEVGLEVTPEDVKFVHALYRTAHDETGDRVDYFFTVKTWKGDSRIMEPEKCDDLQWFPMDNLPENIIHHERFVLENMGKGMKYSEIDDAQIHQ